MGLERGVSSLGAVLAGVFGHLVAEYVGNLSAPTCCLEQPRDYTARFEVKLQFVFLAGQLVLVAALVWSYGGCACRRGGAATASDVDRARRWSAAETDSAEDE